MPIQTKLSKRKYPKGREITIDNIREYSGLENISDEQAQEAVITIRALARMMYDDYMNHKRSQETTIE
jgi:hypothetical protein